MSNKIKYNSFYRKEQTRQGNGQFSGSRHVASNAELDAAQSRREKNDADESKKAQMAALGLGDVDYSEIFAA